MYIIHSFLNTSFKSTPDFILYFRILFSNLFGVCYIIDVPYELCVSDCSLVENKMKLQYLIYQHFFCKFSFKMFKYKCLSSVVSIKINYPTPEAAKSLFFHLNFYHRQGICLVCTIAERTATCLFRYGRRWYEHGKVSSKKKQTRKHKRGIVYFVWRKHWISDLS